MKTLANAMITELETISDKADVVAAAKQMREKQIGSLAVVRRGTLMRDRDERVVGLITETDIIRKVVAEDRNLATITVDMVMTSPMVAVEASWPLPEAYQMMKDAGVRHLLVTRNDVVVGLVSIRDLLVHLHEVL
ncbi:MAG: cyclic nucleotide-binding/CBS domain-containing protein [Nitrospirales bacterium]